MQRIYRIGDPLPFVQVDFADPLARLSSNGYIAKLAFTASD
jgi:hypothetical protein